VPEQIPWPRLVVRAVATTPDDRVYGVFTLSAGKSESAGETAPAKDP
jgi:hypothetical protein